MKTAALTSALILPVLTLLALGGCDKSAPTAPDNATAAAAPTPPAEKDYYADRINNLTDKQRDAVLLKAIKDAGGDCAAMTGSAPHAPVQGRHAWIVHCAADKDLRALDWVVVLQPGGMMSIIRPAAL